MEDEEARFVLATGMFGQELVTQGGQIERALMRTTSTEPAPVRLSSTASASAFFGGITGASHRSKRLGDLVRHVRIEQFCLGCGPAGTGF